MVRYGNYNFFAKRTKGDRASNRKTYLWIVEIQGYNDSWLPTEYSYPTRQRARMKAKLLRGMGFEVRVTPYKACADSKLRNNRQIIKERSDY